MFPDQLDNKVNILRSFLNRASAFSFMPSVYHKAADLASHSIGESIAGFEKFCNSLPLSGLKEMSSQFRINAEKLVFAKTMPETARDYAFDKLAALEEISSFYSRMVDGLFNYARHVQLAGEKMNTDDSQVFKAVLQQFASLDFIKLEASIDLLNSGNRARVQDKQEEVYYRRAEKQNDDIAICTELYNNLCDKLSMFGVTNKAEDMKQVFMRSAESLVFAETMPQDADNYTITKLERLVQLADALKGVSSPLNAYIHERNKTGALIDETQADYYEMAMEFISELNFESAQVCTDKLRPRTAVDEVEGLQQAQAAHNSFAGLST